MSPDKLNNHFANVADIVIDKDKSKSNEWSFQKRFFESKTSKSTPSIPTVTVCEVYNALLQLKQTGTRDLEDLDGKIMKICAPVITDTLTYIYNLCMDKHYFPKRSNKPNLYRSTNQEIGKTLLIIDLSQFCLSSLNLWKSTLTVTFCLILKQMNCYT